MSFTHPHSPFVIAEEFWDLYDHDDIPLPQVPPLSLDEMDHLSRNLHFCQARHEFTVTDEHRRNARHAYFGMISYIDPKVAALREALERSGMADNTIIILTADHGEMMGERGMWFKQHFFEWAARVPLIMHAPARWQSGRVDKNCSLIDIMPTCLIWLVTDRLTVISTPLTGGRWHRRFMGRATACGISPFRNSPPTGPPAPAGW